MNTYSSPFVKLLQAGANAATFGITADTLSDPWVVNDFNAQISWLPSSANPLSAPTDPTDNGFSTLPNGKLKELLSKIYTITSTENAVVAANERHDLFGAAGLTVTVTRTDNNQFVNAATGLSFDGFSPMAPFPQDTRAGVRISDNTSPDVPRSILVRISVAYSAST